ncbi:MAG TPA: transcription antitermination factor NusB [Armatimonadota bacterium]|jgi:N utilization substance protein B
MAVTRRLAREIALKTLYQIAIGGMDADTALDGALDANQPPIAGRDDALAWEAVSEYARALVLGVVANGESYDQTLQRYARDWDPDRMPTVDHILLHIALQELLHSGDVPHGVAINEAVDLAKEYSTEESGKFVNGILGSYVRTEGAEAKK